MQIEQLKLPPPAERWQGQRCGRKVKSGGTHYFDGNTDQCARMARFKINGILFCKQHAGEYALEYIIDKQEAL